MAFLFKDIVIIMDSSSTQNRHLYIDVSDLMRSLTYLMISLTYCLKQVENLRGSHGIAPGEEWDPMSGLNDPTKVQQHLDSIEWSSMKRRYEPTPLTVPHSLFENAKCGEKTSTQAAFGQIMLSIAQAGGKDSNEEESAFADRVVTMAPDVATSTNLTGFVNQRGVFEGGA